MKRRFNALLIMVLVFFVCIKPSKVIAAEASNTDVTIANHVDLRFTSADFDEDAQVTAIIDGKRVLMFLEDGYDGGMKEYRAGNNLKDYFENISLNSDIEFEVKNNIDGKVVTRMTGIMSKEMNSKAYSRCFEEHWVGIKDHKCGMDFIFDYEKEIVNGAKYEVHYFFSNADGTYPDTPEITDQRSGVVGAKVHLLDSDYQSKRAKYEYDGIKTVEVSKITGVLNSDNTDQNPLVLEVYFKYDTSFDEEPLTFEKSSNITDKSDVSDKNDISDNSEKTKTGKIASPSVNTSKQNNDSKNINHRENCKQYVPKTGDFIGFLVELGL